MERHYDRERQLQTRIEGALGAAMPHVELLEVELDDLRETVRVFIDQPGGVMLDTCAEVTTVIRDECPDHALEVSSAGIERPLRSASSFSAVVGHQVRLRQSGERRAHRYTVVEVDDHAGVDLENEAGERRTVPFSEIVRCRLVADVAVPGLRAGKRTKGRR